MVSIFKEKSTSAVFGLVFLAIALHAFFLYRSPEIITTADDGLLYLILNPLKQLSPVFLTLLYYILVLVQALRINHVLNDVRMYQKSSFTASLGYIVLTAMLPAWNNISAALVANSFIIWLLFRIVKLYNTPQPKALVYNIGLITGSLALLFYPALFIIPVIFFALGVTRPFRLNEWFVLLLGIITPPYFYAVYLFLTSQAAPSRAFFAVFKVEKIFPGNPTITAIALGMAGLLFIAGVFTWQAQNNRLQIQVRKMWSVLFIMLLLLVPCVLFMQAAWPNALLLACVPGAAFAGNTFLYSKRLLGALFFWLALAVVVYVNWVPFKI
ncbi:MAG TPA: hypothetical protein VG738_08125 [Chitinophagaceae bacterium]|nr:hypothetical protein [Chitinophagaceae bacterium]